MPTTTRPLTLADCDDFYSLRKEALTASPHSFGSQLDAWLAASREQIEAMLTGPSESPILGVFSDGTLAGMLGFRRERKHNVRHKATLWGFFVRPPHRGQGHGRTLVGAALSHGIECEGLCHIRLIVSATDAAARHVFTLMGFKQYGLELGGLLSGGILYDQVYMMKTL